jgi:hypothetical protein
MFEQRASLANYRGPAVTLLFGMQGGANSPPVVRLTLDVLKAERRTQCSGTPGPWLPALISPAMAQMGGWSPAMYSTPSLTTAVWTIQRDISNGYEHGFHLIPQEKMNNSCPEQLRMDVRLRLTFANGCEVTQEFPNLLLTRP